MLSYPFSKDICEVCASIFQGQLKSTDVTRSVRIDCSSPTPNTPSLKAPSSSRLSTISETEDRSEQRPDQDQAAELPDLPPTLYINGYESKHLRSGYEPSLTDLERLSGADLPYCGVTNQKSEQNLEPPWQRYGTHQQSLASFKRSVVSGCSICAGIKQSVPELTWNDMEQARFYDTGCTTYGLYYFSETTSFWLVFHIGLPHDYPGVQFDTGMTALSLICRPLDYFDRLFETVTTRTRSSSNSANFRVISQWIKECDTEHDCAFVASSVPKYSPTRLLDIGGDARPRLKLIQKDGKYRGPYATLSYCWGSGSPVKLVFSSIAEFERQIREETLPRTMRDAVQVARKIGLRYLWIDALCIVQDSLDDWNRESPQMAEIYGNSYCNIAATRTRDSDDGLFVLRGPGQSGVISVEASWTDIPCHRLGIVDTDFWVKKLDKAPLNSRAWVLQERFMSPRTVHFGDDQILWECYCGYRSEYFPLGPIPGTNEILTKRPFLPPCKTPIKSPENNRAEHYTLWDRLVERFCAGRLTKPSDKLVAISGIAKKLQAEIQDEYIAGMWWGDLPAQLTWSCTGTRTLHYRAPSWSWASLDGDVTYPYLESRVVGLIEKVDYKIEYVTEDKYGQVTSGAIRISGILFPHILAPFQNTYKMIFLDDQLNSLEYAKPVFLDLVNGPDHSENDYFCLPVLREEKTSRHPETMTCLVLQPTGCTQGEYRRIGKYMSVYREDIDIMANLTKPTNTYEYYDPIDLYDSDGLITIV